MFSVVFVCSQRGGLWQQRIQRPDKGQETWNLFGHLWWSSFLWLIFTSSGGGMAPWIRYCVVLRDHYPWYIGSRHTGTLHPHPRLGTSLYRDLALALPPDMSKLVKLGPCCTGTPPDVFKLAHCETRTVGKRTVRILLECFLVLNIFHSDINICNVLRLLWINETGTGT